MPYTTTIEITKVIQTATLAQLTNDAGGSTVDQPNIDKAIADADEVIDGYLRGRYSLPLSSVPTLIGKISTDISIYNIYSRRPERLDINEIVKARYKDAIDSLVKIQKGTITLGIAGTLTPEPGVYKTNKSDEDKIFTDDLLDSMP